MEEKKASVIINLDDDSYAQSFSENSIHNIEIERVKSIILKLEKQAQKNKSDKGEKIYSESSLIQKERFHNTITISGTRGSGKTSFLMTLFNDKDIKEDAEILRIIDPTLIEEKGHIFLSIISLIKDRVDRQISKNYLDDNCITSWRNSLKNLAAGLPVLNGVNGDIDNSTWNDPTYVMEEGLKRVHGANHLECYFHKYIEESLNILNKKFFIMAFDDVDTDFSKGKPVLEMLRKYLTTPQIVTLLSGDLNLYSLLIRKKQWENFGSGLLKNEYDKSGAVDEFKFERYTNLVSQLESQYTMKILKPEYRIVLTPIGEKINMKKIEIQVIANNNQPRIDIKRYYYNHIFSEWGITGNVMKSAYWNFFSTLPIRSQLSILKEYRQEQYQDEEKIIQNITNVFYSELKSKNVEVWDLVNGYGLPNIHLLHFLVDNEILDEGSQLYPRTNDSITNAALVAMGIVIGKKMQQNPAEIFDYIIRVANIVSKSDLWTWHNTQNANEIYQPNIEDYISLSHSYYDYGLNKIASLQGTYCASFDKDNNENKESQIDVFSEGMIPLRGLSRTVKGTRDNNNLRFDEVFQFETKKELKDWLAYIPLFAIQDYKGISKLYYSFYNLLAAIGDLLFMPQEEDIVKELISLSQLRYFAIASKSHVLLKEEERNSDEFTIEEEEENITTEVKSIISPLANKIILWKNKYSKTLIPPYLIGRIMVRTNYSLPRIEKKENLGKILHRQIICFLNAVLVEEAMEKGIGTPNLSNPTKSDNNFIENLKKIIGSKTNNQETDKETKISDLPLFDFISTCPLLGLFMDIDTTNKNDKKIVDFVNIDKYIIDNNFHHYLCDINKKTDTIPSGVEQNTIIKSKIKELKTSEKDLVKVNEDTAKKIADILIQNKKTKVNMSEEDIKKIIEENLNLSTQPSKIKRLINIIEKKKYLG